MELQELYKSILSAINLHVNKEDMVYMMQDGSKEPIMINGRRLVLPTQAILREGLGDQRVAFHPVSENFLTEGETPVFAELKKFITLSLTTKTLFLMTRLAAIASESKSHQKLTPRQHEFLSHVPNLDAKALKIIMKTLEKTEIDGKNKLINLYVRKGGHLNNKSYSRVAMVRFPILEQLEEGKEEYSVFGVHFDRKKDVATLRALIEYIYPEAEQSPGYSVGSSDDMAPGFDSLMRAFLGMVKRINSLVKLFREVLEDGESIKDYRDLLTDTSWEDGLTDLSVYRGLIPNLDASAGLQPKMVQPEQVHQPVAVNVPTVDESRLGSTQPSGSEFNFDMYHKNTQPVLVAPPTIAAPGGYAVIAPPPAEEGVDYASLMAKNNSAMVRNSGYPMGTVGMTPNTQVYLQPGQALPPGYVQLPTGQIVPASMIPPGTMPGMGQPEWMGASVAGAPPPVVNPGMMGAPGMPAARMSTQEMNQMAMRGVYPPGYGYAPNPAAMPMPGQVMYDQWGRPMISAPVNPNMGYPGQPGGVVVNGGYNIQPYR
ncbi:MAG TPA: hypothetical protein VN081_01205 [Dongiaceae bacterium]|nr:hypothetical protein [Dongiaceae bacterium]